MGLLFVALTRVPPPLPAAPSAAPIVTPLPPVAADVWNSRGTLVSHEPYVVSDNDRTEVIGQAWRAVYRSVSGMDGTSRDVSGSFFVPRGDPPAGGWPVISLAHGTTGIGIDCGPSRRADLQGYAWIVGSLLAGKYAVALTDYEGLGPAGSHLYLEPKSAAFNTVDAVRALRALSPAVSTRWVALGYSQGGQAVWAANELNRYYASDLELQGAVALAPAANVTGVADLAWNRTLTAEQRKILPLLIISLARYHPEIDPVTFLHGDADADAQQLSRCDTSSSGIAGAPTIAPVPWSDVVERQRESRELQPATPRDVSTLRDALRTIALPQSPLAAPMLVVSGDRDGVVLEPWVRFAVTASCALGGTIDYVRIADANHQNVLAKAAPGVGVWIGDRFAGTQAPSNCSTRSVAQADGPGR